MLATRALAAATAVILLAFPCTATVVAAQTEPPDVARVSSRDVYGGWGEGAVAVESLGAVAGRTGRSAGDGGGGGGGCRWRVAWRSQGPLEVSTDALASRGALQSKPADDALFAAAFRIQLDEQGAQLIRSGSDADLLRYVVPYGDAECNAAAGAFVTLAEVQAVANDAFAELQRRWPAQEVVLGWPEPTEDTWTALSTSMPWTPISASATSGGLTVTVTAIPTGVEWDTGQINTRAGGERSVLCDGPGDLPRLQEDASCRVWFASPSTGLVDRNGKPDEISLGLTVDWQVGYESNIGGFSDPNWLVWPTVSFLDAVVVNTTQSVAVSRA